MFIRKISNNFPVKGGKIKVERLCVLRKWDHEDYYNIINCLNKFSRFIFNKSSLLKYKLIEGSDLVIPHSISETQESC